MLPRSHLPSVCSISARPLFAAVGGVVLLFGSACAAADVEDREVSLDPAPDEAAASLPDDEPALVAIGPGSGPILDGESDEAAEVEPVKPDETPPGLVVLSVAPGPLAEDSHVVFKGFSEPGTTVTAGEATTVTGDDGRWYLELAIEEGEDTVVTSTDAAGNEIEKEVTVTFEEPEPKPVVYEQPREEPREEPKEEPREEPKEKPEPSLEKEPQHEFTAWTKFGICTEHPVEKTGGEGSEEGSEVLTKFAGTGIPGTAVIVDSDYGEAITEVNDDGYWWIQMEFRDGAGEAEFTAVVRDGERAAWFRCGLI